MLQAKRLDLYVADNTSQACKLLQFALVEAYSTGESPFRGTVTRSSKSRGNSCTEVTNSPPRVVELTILQGNLPHIST